MIPRWRKNDSRSERSPRSRTALLSTENWPSVLRYFVLPLSRKKRLLAGLLITLSLISVIFLDLSTGDRMDFQPLYGVIIFSAFALFGFRGAWWLMGVVAAFQMNLFFPRLRPHLHLEMLDDLVALFAFGGMGLLATWLVTDLQKLDRFHENLRRDLELAGETQRQLISAPVALPWITLEGRFRPTGEVGGDFYFIEPLQEDIVFFAIGDVQGKGVAAALNMARVMALFSELVRSDASIAKLFFEINERLAVQAEWLVTVFAGYASRDTDGRITLLYGKAGHENGLLVRTTGEVQELACEGLPLGVSRGEKYEERSVRLLPGERLILYTDGLVEARNAKLEELGREELIGKVASLAKETAARESRFLADSILQWVNEHMAGNQQSDDIAILEILTMPRMSLAHSAAKGNADKNIS